MRQNLIAAACLLAALPGAALEAGKPTLYPEIHSLLGTDDALLPPVHAKRSFQALVELLHSPDETARKAAIADLGRPDNLTAVPYLGSILGQPGERADVRVAAAMALGRVGNWRTLKFLAPATTDPAREVRFASLLALGGARTRDALPPIVAALERDGDWWVRFAAAIALGESRDPASVKALGEAAHTDAAWQVRMQAARSLGELGSRDAALALAHPLRDPDPGVRAAAAMALGEIGGSDSAALLAGVLATETAPLPRQVIAGSLRKLGR